MMKNTISLKRIFTLFSFLLLTSFCLQAQAVQLGGTVFGGSSPLSDVQVSLYVQGEDESSAIVTTDNAGQYLFDVSVGTYDLAITPSVSSGYASTGVTSIIIDASDVIQNIVLINNASVLSGIVRDGNGSPISNIQLTMNDQASGTKVATLTSDVNGAYSFSLADGSYEIDIQYTNGNTANQPSPKSFHIWPVVANLTVAGATTYDIDLPFVELSGTTIDANGVAVAGVTVDVPYHYWSDSSSGFRQFFTITTSSISDADGNYSLVGVKGLDNEIIIPPAGSGFAQTVLNGLNLQTDTSQAIILNIIDTVAPTLLNGPLIRDITSSSAVIEWTTDEPTNSVVIIGGQTINDSAFVTHHVVPVTGLTANRSYSVTVESMDSQGNGSASGVASFITLETPDNQAPVIINGPLVEQVTHNSAIIKFTTDEVATGVVKLYQGETLITQLNTALTTEHQVLFSDLNANVSYEVQVEVTDSLANGPTLSQRVGFVTLAIADTTAPIILSGPFISNVTSSEATVTWVTNEPATSGISYNDGTAYGVLSNDELTTDHKMRLTGLESGIEYSVTVSSQDAKANGPTRSQVEIFTTLVTLDTTAPKLLGMPLIHEINNSHVGLFVHTDEAAAVHINFGISADKLTQKAGQTEAGIKTKINLQHLDAATQYYYQVQLTDESGNTSLLPEIYSVITAAQNKNKALIFAVPPVVEYTSESTMVVIWRTHQQTEGQLRCIATNGDVQLVQSKVIDNDSGNRSKGLRHQATLTDLALNAAYECSAVAYTAKDDPIGMPVEQTQLTVSLFEGAITGGGTVTMNAEVDATAPIFLSEPAVVYISNSLAVIEWDTDELANASVSYWPQGSTEIQRKSSTEFLSTHQVSLNNLSQSTIYEYQVEVTDPSGNVTFSEQKTLTTSAIADNSSASFVQAPSTNGISMNSFSIAFNSDELTTAQISYGFFSSDLSLQTSIDTPRTVHQITLTDLDTNSTYFYKVTLSDFAGNINESDVVQVKADDSVIIDTDSDLIEDTSDTCPLNSGLSSVNYSSGDIQFFQYCLSNDAVPQIHFQLELSDGFSSAQSIQILYWLTDNEQHWITATRDPITGIFIANIELNQYTTSGIYDVRAINLIDNQGVEVNLNQDQLNVLGFNTSTSFSNSDSDNTKPSPTNVTSSGWHLNESDQPQINFEVVVEDNLSGVQETTILELSSPTGTSLQEHGTQISANTYSFEFILNKYASSGVYQVNTIRLYDNAGNSNFSQNWIANNLQGYQLTNPNSDAILPSLSYINLSAKFDEESDRPIITIDGVATDDVSGIEKAYIRLTRPNGGDLDKWQDIEQNGSVLSKTFSSQIELPQIYENGEYQVDFVMLNDFAGNENTLSKTDIDQQNQSSVTLLNLYYPDDETSTEYNIESSIKDDFIFGANRSNDYLSGLTGNDFIFSGDGDDHVVAGEGDDLVIGGSGQGNDIYEGNEGIDTLKYTSAELPIIVDFINGSAYGVNIDDDIFSGFERIIAGQGNDIIITDSNVNVVFGYTGDDVIVTSSGADELSGDDGSDEFVFNDLTLSISTNFTTIVDYKPEDRLVIKEYSTVSNLAWNNNLSDSITDINIANQLYFTTDGKDGYLILVHDMNAKENSFVSKLSNINSTDNLSILDRSSKDFDDDGNYDYFDTDDDNDGVLDAEDAFPLDTTESVDTDGDTIGNNADTDDDADGIPDNRDFLSLTSTSITSTSSAFTALKADGSVFTWGDADMGGDSSSVASQLINVYKIYSSDGAFAALKHDGTVVVWGDSTYGGDSSTVAGQLTNIQSISNTYQAFSALKTDGTVITWGRSDKGGNSTDVSAQLTNVKAVYSNPYAFVALKQDGSVVSWGNTTYGGNSNSVTSELTDVVAIYNTGNAFAALKTDGTVVTWGVDDNGGDSSSVASQLNGILSISSTNAAFAALKSDGSVITWGDAAHGGDSTAVASQLSNIQTVYSNPHAFAAVKNDGSVITWGSSVYGGNSNTVTNELINVQQIYSTNEAFAALKTDGSVVTWGNASDGGDSSDVADKLTNILAIYNTDIAFAALNQDGTVITWPKGVYGGGSKIVASQLNNILAIYGNTDSFTALKQDGSIVTWGKSDSGGDNSAVKGERLFFYGIDTDEDGIADDLDTFVQNPNESVDTDEDGIGNNADNDDDGDGTLDIDDALPLDKTETVDTDHDAIGNNMDTDDDGDGIPDNDDYLPLTATKIVSTKSAFAALRNDGTVFSWGDAGNGGDSSQISTQLTNVNSIYHSDKAFAALKTDGTVISWGDENYGGDSSNVADQLNNIQSIRSTGYAFAALKTDGSVVAWGHSSYGGNSNDVSTQLTNIKAIFSNNYAFAALLADGTVITWGSSTYGGDSSKVAALLTDVQAIYNTKNAFVALKTDGTVVTWGADSNGGDSSSVANLLTNIQTIYSTKQAFSALKEDGTLVSWGHKDYGGDSSAVTRQLNNVQTVYTTDRAFAAQIANGTVITWGGSNYGGDSSAVSAQLTDIKVIYNNSSAFAALKTDGTVISWGSSSTGGDSNEVSSQLTKMQHIYNTDEAFAALKENGSVISWGGTGGDSSLVSSELTNIQSIYNTSNAFAALKNSGEVITWGQSSYGGDNSAVAGERLFPEDIDGDGVNNPADAFPLDETESVDSDGDGIGNNADTDDDNDGIEDNVDAFITNAAASIDTDLDGLPDVFHKNCSETCAINSGLTLDLDDDNDGVSDNEDFYPLDPEKSEDTRIALNIYSPQNVYGVDVGESVTIPVMYQASDDSQIGALSFKLYFNSQLLRWNQVTNLISTGLLGGMDTVYEDIDDSDSDALTDSYLQVTWFDLSNNWPGESGEIKLFDIEFTLLQYLAEDTTSLTIVGDDAGTSTGYKVVTKPVKVAMSFNLFSLDVNSDGKVSLPIDGFIILRSMVGFPASALASDDDMLDTSRTRNEMSEILNNAKDNLLLDINGDGKVSLPIDGFIILRHMVGFPASALASDEDMVDATRTKDEMKSYLESF
jgi:hypothetical protein